MNKLILLFSVMLISASLMAQGPGYMNLTTFGILAGTSSDEKPAALSILSEHNYFLSKNLSAGIITGIEQLNENLLPAAANLKIFFPAGACNFFISGQGGYSISLEKPKIEGISKAKGGFMAGIETGILIRVNSGSSVVIGLGYRHNKLNYELEDWWIGDYKRKITLNRFSIRLGIAIY